MSREKDKINRRNEDILNRLDKLTWIGRLTNSTVGLVVPFKTAFEELTYYYKELKEPELRSILKVNNIVVVSSPEDLDKYRGNHIDRTKRR